MKALCIPTSDNGICYGLVAMALQAFIIDDYDKHQQRLESINSLSEKDVLHMRAIQFLDLQSLEAFKRKRSNRHQNLVDIVAFLQGVSLFFRPDTNLELFQNKAHGREQNILLTAPIVQNRRIEEEKGLVRVSVFSGVYDQKELSIYIESYAKAMKNAHIRTHNGWLLGNSNHAVMLGYDLEKGWLLNNNGKGDFSTDAKEVCENIRKSFLGAYLLNLINQQGRGPLIISTTPFNPLIFSTEVFTTRQRLPDTQNFLDYLYADYSFSRLHQVTPEKANARDPDNANWLYIATRQGQIEVVRELLDKGISSNQGIGNEGVLYVAAGCGHLEITQLLLQRRANVNQPGYNDFSPLYCAAYGGHTAIVRELLMANAAVNQTHEGGMTPLLVAIQNNYVASVEELFKGGADPNQKRSDGIGALHLAAGCGRLEIVQLFLQKGVDPNPAGNNGETPLHCAVEQGQIAIVHELLVFNAAVTKAKHSGETVLHIAARQGYIDIIDCFLTSCKNEIKSIINSPAQLTIEILSKEMKRHWRLEKFKECLNSLDIKESELPALTPMDIAIFFGHNPIAKKLLREDADITGIHTLAFLLLNDKNLELVFEIKTKRLQTCLKMLDTLLKSVLREGDIEIVKLEKTEDFDTLKRNIYKVERFLSHRNFGFRSLRVFNFQQSKAYIQALPKLKFIRDFLSYWQEELEATATVICSKKPPCDTYRTMQGMLRRRNAQKREEKVYETKNRY
ncbi:ankyrin repeat domain-containing protein [Coxiella burnetii]|nr:ankyrin repeat domain-containing protein [Coxiella burnetii]